MKGSVKQYTSEHVTRFLEHFSRESEPIRKEIAGLLPSYNELLNMHALSFEEFALLPLAKEEHLPVSDPLFDYSSVIPLCPKCKSKGKVRFRKVGFYECKACNSSFTANHNSISAGSKCPAVIWLKVLRCMLDFYSVDRTCEVCQIARNTYYHIRNSLFYAMQIMMDEVKLYGNIQCDNTFISLNLKGSNLRDEEYPEGSPFDSVRFVPRQARSRGGSYTQKEVPLNSVCIFTAIDDSGHVFTRFIGIGPATATLLKEKIGTNKILLTVPAEDPFPLQVVRKQETSSKPGNRSLLISDKEAALIKFAEKHSIPHEYHVYRRNGKQVRLSSDAHHIQAVNRLHQRLKLFLTNANYVSTKYLPGFLVFFEFVMNTGASAEAIEELFCILARPGLKKPTSYFQDLYTVPNHLVQWLQEDNPLKRIPFQQLLAYHLYAQCQDLPMNQRKKEMPIAEISQQTGYSRTYIRKIYNNLNASGYDALIREFFASKKKEAKKTTKVSTYMIAPEILAFFDEYVAMCALPKHEQTPFIRFIPILNEKYGTNYKTRTIKYYFKRIVNLGLRPPIPPRSKKYFDQPTPYVAKGFSYLKEFKDIAVQARREGINPPVDITKYSMIAERHNVTPSYVRNAITFANRFYAHLQSDDE